MVCFSCKHRMGDALFMAPCVQLAACALWRVLNVSTALPAYPCFRSESCLEVAHPTTGWACGVSPDADTEKISRSADIMNNPAVFNLVWGVVPPLPPPPSH